MVANGKPFVGLPGIGKDLAGKITGNRERPGGSWRFSRDRGADPDRRSPRSRPFLASAQSACTSCTRRSVSRPSRISNARPRRQDPRTPGLHSKDRREESLAEIERRSASANNASRSRPPRTSLKAYAPILKTQPRASNASWLPASYCRRKETVGDLDILVTCAQGPAAVAHFIAYDEVAKVVAKGSTRATVLLAVRHPGGPARRSRQELRRSAALFHWLKVAQHCHPQAGTGTWAQNQRVWYSPAMAHGSRKRRGGSLLLPSNSLMSSPSSARTAAKFRQPLPGKLPKLISLEDIRGDLHVHTKASDGKSSSAGRWWRPPEHEGLSVRGHY